MTPSAVAGQDPSYLEVHHFPTIERQQPADRSSEPHAALVPAHGPWKGEVLDQRRQEIGQKFVSQVPWISFDREDIVTLWGLSNFQVFHGHHLRACKPDRCIRRLAGCIKGVRFGWSHRFLDRCRLATCERGDHQHKASRGSKRVHCSMRKAMFFQEVCC